MPCGDRRAEALEQLAVGRDPVDAPRQAKADADCARANTFMAVVEQGQLACALNWSPGHAAIVWRNPELHVLTALGNRPLAELRIRDLMHP